MPVIIGREAKKQYDRLPRPQQLKVKKKLAQLENQTAIGKKLEGEYAGQYSLRAWPYRVIYTLDRENPTVWILSILHRQGAYKK